LGKYPNVSLEPSVCREKDAAAMRQLAGFFRFFGSDSGGSMVEFAIAAGFLFAPLFFGIFEFGLAFWSKNAAAGDAREAARYAIVRGSTSANVATVDSIRQFVKQRTSLRTFGPDSIRVYASWPTNNHAGSMVYVSIAQPVPRRVFFIPAHTDSV
jgi:hypothetical protein